MIHVPFLDLHSHFLPGLDDGAPDPGTGMAMLRALADLGFSDVTATPHQKPGQYLPTLQAIGAAYTATVAAAAGASLPLTLHLAAENMWDDLLHQRVEGDAIPSYDGGPAFLFELQLMHLPPALADFLFRLRRKDWLPVLAHPERYEPLWSDLALAEKLAASCALVVDLPALAGKHGRQRTKPARRMIEEGIACAVATDCHSVADVADAAEGMAWIRKRLGDRALHRLLADNPRRIVAGELPGLVRLAINITLSLGLLVLCTWLVWPTPQARADLEAAVTGLSFATFWPHLAGFLGLLAVTHFCRAWRWNNLLRPIGVDLPAGRLLAVSSVGFMFILALPARLGEFVRPALIREKGKVSASAALGTVAVERIVDGLLVSLFVFVAFFFHRDHPYARAQGWMMPTAWLALAVFTAALVFLGFALRWPERSVRIAVTMTGARWYAPRMAAVLQDKLRSMIDGFLVLRDRRNLIAFLLWSVAYWVANSMSFWVLARGFDLDVPVVGAFAVTGLIAVGISVPNTPALMGQFQWLTQLGLTLYVGDTVADGAGLAFAILLWALQVAWYIGVGAIALATPYVSLAEVWRSRRPPDNDPAHPERSGAG